MLYQISAPHMCAGISIEPDSDSVVIAAPIVSYMFGWPFQRVSDHCKEKRWHLAEVTQSAFSQPSHQRQGSG